MNASVGGGGCWVKVLFSELALGSLPLTKCLLFSQAHRNLRLALKKIVLKATCPWIENMLSFHCAVLQI